MSDPRIEKINEKQVYGLFHNEKLIYIGETKHALQDALYRHRSFARNGRGSPIDEYILWEVLRPEKELSIRKIVCESKQEALDKLGDQTLNQELNSSPSSRGYDWTPEELDILESHTCTEAAEILEASERTCRMAASKLGLLERHTQNDNHKNKIPWGQWDEKLGTMPDRKLAEKIGCSRKSVQRRRNKLGVDAHQKGISEDIAEEISRQYHNTDATYRDLAEKYDVGRSTIGRIIDNADKTPEDCPNGGTEA